MKKLSLKRILFAFAVAVMVISTSTLTAFAASNTGAIQVFAADGGGGGATAPFELASKTNDGIDTVKLTYTKAVAGTIHPWSTNPDIAQGTELVDYNGAKISVTSNNGVVDYYVTGARGETSTTDDKRELKVVVVGGFKANTTYTVHIDKHITARNGNDRTEAPDSYTFTTGAI